MTARQIQKKIEAAGISITKEIEIRHGEVEVCVGYTERNGFGSCDDKRTTALANKIRKAVGKWGSYSTGYGAIVLQEKMVDLGDYNDKSSRWHY